MTRMTIFRSDRMAIAMMGAMLAPIFASAQQPSMRIARNTRAPAAPQVRVEAPTIRPGEFYAAPWVDRDEGPANAGHISGTTEVPGVPLTITERPLQSYERITIVVPPGMSSATGARYLAVRRGPKLEGIGQVMIPTGIVRVEQAGAGEAVQARIVARFEPVMIGDELVTMEPVPTGSVRPAAQATGTQTSALWIMGDPVLPSLQSYVVVRGGSTSGMRAGDQITFYRERYTDREGVVQPESPVAVAQIVRVSANASTALIIDQMHAGPNEGTLARVSAKMP